jgi:hypothetical protein
MQIYFERSGGFMGLQLKTAVDTVQLPAGEAEEWEQSLTAARFFELPSNLDPQSGADRMIYKLTVVTTEQQHTAFFTDEDAPEALRPLLRRLTIMARQ